MSESDETMNPNSAPTSAAMREALIDDAIDQELARTSRITSVAGFKNAVRQNLEDGERSHPGYIAKAYTALVHRRQRVEHGSRPSPAPYSSQTWRDEPDGGASPATAARWHAIHVVGQKLAGQPEHPLRVAIRETAASPTSEHDALQVLGYLEAVARDATAGPEPAAEPSRDDWSLA